jgi:AcrR family transcriptional regulator
MDAKTKRRSPRQALEDIITAAHSEFKEQGYERTTTAAIARKARVSESQIYRYFATKLDLFHEAIFHYIERDIEDFYNAPSRAKPLEEYAGTINEIAAHRVMELQEFFKKNSEAILTILFTRAYIPNAKGLGEVEAIGRFFDRATEGVIEYRGLSRDEKRKSNPNLILRALFLSILANSIFRDVVFPVGIASEEEIDLAVAKAAIGGLSGFSTKKKTDGT